MAARPGEDNVATLFADVHYLYSEPTAQPLHHRFDKSSYVYLFEDASQGRARLEIANRPGTDDQDAFEGYLDSVRLVYSYKQTCVVALTVGDVGGPDEWHLPAFDPHNQAKYHYRLRSLDIYFWTQPDALQFVNAIRRVLPPGQCEVLDEPGPPPRQDVGVSSVVQRLERVAVDEEKTDSSAPSFAPPPLSAVSGGDPSSPQSFAPIPYNPAAPAAPEQIRPREKTPPPDDGGVNPLHQTLAHDYTAAAAAQQPFSPGLAPSGSGPLSPAVPPPQFQPPPGAPSFPAPPQPHGIASPGLPPQGFGSLGAVSQTPSATPPAGAPPPHRVVSRTSTGLASPGIASPGIASPYGSGVFPGSPGFAQQHTPTPPNLASPGLAHPPPPPPPPPVSQYPYTPGAQTVGGPPVDYGIHQQAYRPAEGEAAQYRPKPEGKGRLEENAGRLERGVTGMLKKFEKKFG